MAELRRNVLFTRIAVLVPVVLASIAGAVPTLGGSASSPLDIVLGGLLPIPPGVAVYACAILVTMARWRRAAQRRYHLEPASIRTLSRMFALWT